VVDDVIGGRRLKKVWDEEFGYECLASAAIPSRRFGPAVAAAASSRVLQRVSGISEPPTLFDELEEWAMNEQEIREALEEWEKLSVSPENRYAYEMRLKWLRDQLSNLLGERRAGLEEGLKKGREEGRKEGRKEGVQQVALEMLRAGLDHEMIMSVTKLSREELNELAKKTLEN
jgi:predicted transposase/invertase (TIGR01784 family)